MISRRELTVLLFCSINFIVFFNLTATIDNLGVAPQQSSSGSPYLRRGPSASLTSDFDEAVDEDSPWFEYDELYHRNNASKLLTDQGLRDDGRRDTSYEDELEREILGTWEKERQQEYDLSPHGFTARQQSQFWGSSIDALKSKLVSHVPGYTIVENVFVWNGTIYLVTDDRSSFPESELILSSPSAPHDAPSRHELQVITPEEALERFGQRAGRMPGVSWICYDTPELLAAHHQTLLALFRAYSALAAAPRSVQSVLRQPSPSTHDTHAQTFVPPLPAVSSAHALPPPDQIYFPHVGKRQFPATGIDTMFVRMLFPDTHLEYKEDWKDFVDMARPVYYERVVLADQGAALRGLAKNIGPREDVLANRPNGKTATSRVNRDVPYATTLEEQDRQLAFAAAFQLPTQVDWFTELRENLLAALSLPPESPRYARHSRIASSDAKVKSKDKVITYISAQGLANSSSLTPSAHQRLVSKLTDLARSQKWRLNVVELKDGETASSWVEHMTSAVQSSVMVGPHGALASSMFMRPAPTSSFSLSKAAPAVFELFPLGTFDNSQEFVARTLGMEYHAVQPDRTYTAPSLPPVSHSHGPAAQRIDVDVDSLAKAVREQMRRW